MSSVFGRPTKIFPCSLILTLQLVPNPILMHIVSASVIAQDDDLSLGNIPGDVAFATADVQHTTIFPDYATKSMPYHPFFHILAFYQMQCFIIPCLWSWIL
jgi:hypothetical protein